MSAGSQNDALAYDSKIATTSGLCPAASAGPNKALPVIPYQQPTREQDPQFGNASQTGWEAWKQRLFLSCCWTNAPPPNVSKNNIHPMYVWE
eukprot:11617899-Heterocapsa_arctica.AAC.1